MTAAKNITPATSCRKPSEDVSSYIQPKILSFLRLQAEDADLKDELRLLVEKIVVSEEILLYDFVGISLRYYRPLTFSSLRKHLFTPKSKNHLFSKVI